jgi:asparagine synthase (glutamine-hydrolysing)
MCGFAGFFGAITPYERDEPHALLKRMTDVIAHRGPDDAGYWCDAERGIGLGHRRLSIVDLSPAGHQPMLSASGRYVIVYNGEIYNHPSLREQLDRTGRIAVWRGHSDTETLLAGFDVWGIQGTLERAIGMFAFAVWDRYAGTLTLARDRIGEKPLYYGWQGSGRDSVFLFGSELKALRAHPGFAGTISRNALSLLMRHNYIPAPYSIYEGIAKLPAGCLLTVAAGRLTQQPTAYWSAAEQAARGIDSRYPGSEGEAVDELERLLKDAIGKQMMADVPLGAFLSGGVDSSTVVALMQAQSSRPIKTFSIGFHEDGYNEAEYAKAVARHLGTDHTELYVTPDEAMTIIPRLPSVYDEPFADSSQIPTILVSQLARRHVTVSLSGDAGDELFCGYKRYQTVDRLWNMLGAGPLPLRRLAAKGLTSISTQSWNKMAGKVMPFLPASMRHPNPGDKLHKGAGIMTSTSLDALYRGLVSHWDKPTLAVKGATEPATLLTQRIPALEGMDGIPRMMALELLTYLPDDILVKVDRAAMSVSLETRVPFLDHRVVEFAWRLPQSYKLRNGVTKWPLRQVLYKYVPQALIERPKMGFSVPIGDWLRGPLRGWAQALLDPARLRAETFFEPALIRQKWEEHQSGRRNWQYQLWNVLMFQAWYEQQEGGLRCRPQSTPLPHRWDTPGRPPRPAAHFS